MSVGKEGCNTENISTNGMQLRCACSDFRQTMHLFPYMQLHNISQKCQCHDKEDCQSQFSTVTSPALPHTTLERKQEWCINGYSCYGTFIIKVVLDTVLAALTMKFQRYIHSGAVLAADGTDTDSHSDRLGNGEQTALLLNTLFMLPLLTEFSHNVTARKKERMTTTTPACHTRIIFSPASAKGRKSSPLMWWFDTQASCVR